MTLRTPTEVLTSQDIVRIIQSMGDSHTHIRNSTILTVLWKTGIRVQEVLDLRVVELDVVRTSFNIRGRFVPVDVDTMKMVAKWLSSRPVYSDFVFCSMNSRKLSERYTRQMMGDAARAAGIKKPAYPTILRRVFARDMESLGMKLGDIADLLGHKSTRTTAGYLDGGHGD